MRLPLGFDLPPLSAAQRQLATFLEARGCAAELLFRVELVVEEAAMNVIRHARPAGATSAALIACITGGRATVAIEDDGPAFNPLAAPVRATRGAIDGSHQGGFGLHLIRRNTVGTRYARTVAGINRLELDFPPR